MKSLAVVLLWTSALAFAYEHNYHRDSAARRIGVSRRLLDPQKNEATPILVRRRPQLALLKRGSSGKSPTRSRPAIIELQTTPSRSYSGSSQDRSTGRQPSIRPASQGTPSSAQKGSPGIDPQGSSAGVPSLQTLSRTSLDGVQSQRGESPRRAQNRPSTSGDEGSPNGRTSGQDDSHAAVLLAPSHPSSHHLSSQAATLEAPHVLPISRSGPSRPALNGQVQRSPMSIASPGSQLYKPGVVERTIDWVQKNPGKATLGCLAATACAGTASGAALLSVGGASTAAKLTGGTLLTVGTFSTLSSAIGGGVAYARRNRNAHQPFRENNV